MNKKKHVMKENDISKETTILNRNFLMIFRERFHLKVNRLFFDRENDFILHISLTNI